MDNWSKTESLKYLREKIDHVKVAMLTTYNNGNGFNSRPMATADVDEEGNIWFFTNEHSPKASEISIENRVSLTYSDPDRHTYLSLIGDASLIADKENMKALWNPFIKAFFPGGIEDPNLILLKITLTDAEYWDSRSSSMVVLFNMLKAAVSGVRYDEGKHGQIAL
jgi:general stress protein 26